MWDSSAETLGHRSDTVWIYETHVTGELAVPRSRGHSFCGLLESHPTPQRQHKEQGSTDSRAGYPHHGHAAAIAAPKPPAPVGSVGASGLLGSDIGAGFGGELGSFMGSNSIYSPGG